MSAPFVIPLEVRSGQIVVMLNAGREEEIVKLVQYGSRIAVYRPSTHVAQREGERPGDPAEFVYMWLYTGLLALPKTFKPIGGGTHQVTFRSPNVSDVNERIPSGLWRSEPLEADADEGLAALLAEQFGAGPPKGIRAGLMFVLVDKSTDFYRERGE